MLLIERGAPVNTDMREYQLSIRGMTCVNCERKIKKRLAQTAGVARADVRFDTARAAILFDWTLVSERDIRRVIREAGYEPDDTGSTGRAARAMGYLLMIAALSILFAQAQRHGIFDRFPLAEAGMGVPLLFLAGLLTSVHCVAMCGGICLTQTVRGARHPLLPGALYNLGRVVSYTVIGGIVGAVGTVVQPSGMFRGAVQLIAGAFMVIMGLSMLGLFPRLNRLVPRMPARFAGIVDAAKTRAAGPFVVGLLNGLMPCGPLQAMQLYALSSGSAARGALGMLAFSLGTVPLMLGLGALASALGRRFTRRAMAAGAVLVAVLGISMFSQGFRLSGQSTVTADAGGSAARTEDVQVVNSTLSSGAYPDITVRAGVPVRWVIDAPQGSVNGCNYDMVIGVYGIEYQFQTEENVIAFTPTQAGTYDYTCWMGMISGTITVVDEKTQGGLEG